MAELLYRLGVWSARKPWIVIGTWLVLLAMAATAFAFGFKGLQSSFDIPNMPSSKVIEDLQKSLPEYSGASGAIVIQTEDGTPLSDDQRTAITALSTELEQLPDVARVVDPFQVAQQRTDAAAQLASGRQQLDAGRAQLDAQQAQLTAGLGQLTAGRAQLEAGLAQAQAAGAPAATIAGLQAKLEALAPQQAQLDAGQAQLDAARAELDAQATAAEQGGELLALADSTKVLSDDGSTALVNVVFTDPRLELSDDAKQSVIDTVDANPIPGAQIGMSSEIAQSLPQLIGPGEVIGLLIAAIVLGVMLRRWIGAMIPLVTASTGVGVAVLSALALSGVVQMAVVTPVLGVMLGLAVGIDYSLFVLNRHRKQLAEGAEVVESIGLATGTSGNAVVFAGATVVIALLALNITGVPFLGLMGSVGAVAVTIAVLIAITLTPAVLGLAGHRVADRPSVRRAARLARSTREASAVRPMSWWRAGITVIVATAALLAIATPALSMRVGLPDGSTEPVGSAAQRAYTMTETAFGAGANSPLLVTAALPAGLDDAGIVAAQLQVATAIAEVDGVTAVAPVAVADDGSVAAFQVKPDGGPNSESTEAVVQDLRALGSVEFDQPDAAGGPATPTELTLGVAGQAAINLDISDRLLGVLPIYLTVVVGLALLIMIVVFRSLLVPVIAAGGFILSLFATYGAVTAVFQLGWGADLLGIHQTGPVLNFLPVILIGILFGLAMDYQLFLASGMREAFVHGAPARLAVAQGFRAGRAVVTAAGLIMVAVFGGFIFSESTMIRSMGLGLAAGILFDAFVVRMLLMPALMHLIGPAAWWLPRWLDRIVPNVDVEGAALERRHHAVPAPAGATPQ